MQPPTSTAAPRRARRGALAVAVAVTALTGLDSDAHAAFDGNVGRCTGNAITGRGASFQRSAQDGFFRGFTQAPNDPANGRFGCPGANAVTYDPAGSGAGRNALGASDGKRDVTVHFAGSDEGPSAGQIGNMNAGLTGADDDARVHVLPVASSAIASVVNYPNDPMTGAVCPVPTTYQDPSSGRLRVPNALLERAWAGEFATWGDFIGLTGGCGSKPLVRVVRQDSSGTTFAWKDFLSQVKPSRGWRSNAAYGVGSSLANRSWPNTRSDGEGVNPELGSDPDRSASPPQPCDQTYNPSATGNPVCRAGKNGNGAANGVDPQLSLLRATDGAIGYADLSGAARNGFQQQPGTGGTPSTDDTYWMPLQVRSDTSIYLDPAVNPDGFQSGGTMGSETERPTGGARCATAQVRDVPPGDGGDPTLASADPSRGQWFNTTQSFSPGNDAYSACTLTYDLAWDDPAPVYLSLANNAGYDGEQRAARQVRDYLEFAVSDDGQNALTDRGYAKLPVGVLSITRTGVQALGWNKQGRFGAAQQTAPASTTTSTTAPGQTVKPSGPSAPSTPSNVFAIKGIRTSGTNLIASLALPGPGQVSLTATLMYKVKTKAKKGKKAKTVTKSVTFALGGLTTAQGGDVALRLPRRRAAATALAKATGRRGTVAVTVTYTPKGGTANTVKAPTKLSVKR